MNKLRTLAFNKTTALDDVACIFILALKKFCEFNKIN